MGSGGKSVSALSRAGLGLGGGAAAQPLVAWLQREGGKGRAGFPTEAEDCKQRRPLQSQHREGAARSDIRRDFPAVWAMTPCPGESRIFCCTDSTKERFLWVA